MRLRGRKGMTNPPHFGASTRRQRRQLLTLTVGAALLPACPGVGAFAGMQELNLKPLAVTRRGPPCDIYLLQREGDQEIELCLSRETTDVGVFHWQSRRLHRDGDLPAVEIFDRVTGARRLTVYARQGIYRRDDGGPTSILYTPDGHGQNMRGCDGQPAGLRKTW